MPGANFPIFGCGVSRNLKYRGLVFLTFPLPQRDRVVVASFRKQIEEGDVHICKRHFKPEDIEIRKYLCGFHFYTSTTIIPWISFEAAIFEIAEKVDVLKREQAL